MSKSAVLILVLFFPHEVCGNRHFHVKNGVFRWNSRWKFLAPFLVSAPRWFPSGQIISIWRRPLRYTKYVFEAQNILICQNFSGFFWKSRHQKFFSTFFLKNRKVRNFAIFKKVVFAISSMRGRRSLRKNLAEITPPFWVYQRVSSL